MSKKLSVIAATAATLPALVFASPVLAATTGQVEGGDIYRVRNVSTNSDFMDPATAVCGNVVQFRVRIHNPGPGALNNVKVSATLDNTSSTSHSSKVTITADNTDPAAPSTSDTAGVKTDKATTLSYVSGSTELLDAHGSKLSNIADLTSGATVNIGTVGVSVEQKRFVQFEAKLNCETTPPKQIQVCEIATKKIVTINEKDFNSTTQTKDLSKCAETPVTPPTELPNTGAGNVVGIVGGAIVAGFVASRLFLSRKTSR